jgi:heptosyltransferase I
MSQTTNSLKSICIIRLSSIGDITHMIPIIKTLQAHSPITNITWIIGKTEYQLVKNIKNVEFIVINKKNILETIMILLKLRKRKYFDALLHMQVSLRSNLMTLFIKATRKIGFDKSKSKNFHSLFINETIDSSGNTHVLETFFYFLSKIGIKEREYSKDISIEDSKISVLPAKEKYIVFNPFTSSRKFNYREWDINNYKIITDYLANNYNISSVIIGGHSKYELEKSILFNKKNNLTNMVGKTNLQDIYNLIKSSELYIGPDSGTLHIASMLLKPVIGLYATSNPLRTGPYYEMKYTINKYPEALMMFNKKTEDTAKWGERVRNKNAMSLIKTQDVIDSIDKILKF